jgi:hypothetical protein
MITYGESRNGYFGTITLFALLGVVRLAALIWRSHSTWDRIDLAILALGITMVWISSLRQRRICDRLLNRIENVDLVRLYGNTVGVAVMTCVMISIALHIGR